MALLQFHHRAMYGLVILRQLRKGYQRMQASSYQMDQIELPVTLVVVMSIFFKTRRRPSCFAPTRLGYKLCSHVHTHYSQIFLQWAFSSHRILFDCRQEILGLDHVLGRFRIPKLVFDAIQHQHLMKQETLELEDSRRPQLQKRPEQMEQRTCSGL